MKKIGKRRLLQLTSIIEIDKKISNKFNVGDEGRIRTQFEKCRDPLFDITDRIIHRCFNTALRSR